MSPYLLLLLIPAWAILVRYNKNSKDRTDKHYKNTKDNFGDWGDWNDKYPGGL